MLVNNVQYDDAPAILTLLSKVIRDHADLISEMSLIEDKIHVVTKTPQPKPAKRAKKVKPNADVAQSDEPEAKTEQAPVKPPHLEVLQWSPVKPQVRTRPGCGRLLLTLTVHGGIWALMTPHQREMALLTECLRLRVTLPEDGDEPKISKRPLPIQTHPEVLKRGGAWYESMDPCAGADGLAATAVLLGEDAPRMAADLPADALACGSDDEED